jgi:hypothetical protein
MTCPWQPENVDVVMCKCNQNCPISQEAGLLGSPTFLFDQTLDDQTGLGSAVVMPERVWSLDCLATGALVFGNWIFL